MAKVSIIVPIYNTEEYLERCIDSIISQTLKDIEIILVNDGSPDNCGAICDKYLITDNRIKVIHKENGGPSDARNVGISCAIGDYIGFVDSDDYIEIDMYEKLYHACTSTKSLISMCGRFDVFEEKKIPVFSFDGIKIWSSKDAIGNFLTWDNIDSSPCDKLFHNSLFQEIKFPVGKSNEDIYIIPSLIYRAKKITHIGEPKYNYFHRHNSRSNEKFTESKMDLIEASLEILDFVKLHYKDLVPKAISFYQIGILNLLRLFKSKENRQIYNYYYKYLKKLLSENIYSIIRSKYINLNYKVIAILVYIRLYHLLIFLKDVIPKLKYKIHNKNN